jgi:hypothetical protein
MVLDDEIMADFGWTLHALCHDQANWSQETFGSDADRGPIGALKHLEKEAREAQEDFDLMEFADCFLLTVDAARRAGFTFPTLVFAAMDKMEINKQREWPMPVSDEPVEHVR